VLLRCCCDRVYNGRFCCGCVPFVEVTFVAVAFVAVAFVAVAFVAVAYLCNCCFLCLVVVVGEAVSVVVGEAVAVVGVAVAVA